MVITRSSDKLRRGCRERKLKLSSLKRISKCQRGIQRRSFTAARITKAQRFVMKAESYPRKFGGFGTYKWYEGLLAEINEPGVVNFHHLEEWVEKRKDIFNAKLYKIEDSPSCSPASEDMGAQLPGPEEDLHSEDIGMDEPKDECSPPVILEDVTTLVEPKDKASDEGSLADFIPTIEDEDFKQSFKGEEYNIINDLRQLFLDSDSPIPSPPTSEILNEWKLDEDKMNDSILPKLMQSDSKLSLKYFSNFEQDYSTDLGELDQGLLNEVYRELDIFFN